MKRNPKHAGELAEIAFMGRAMGMGLIVTQPYGDNARYDFAVDNGKRFKRVQVKSRGALAKGRGSYNVNVGRHTARGAVPYLKSEIHAVAVLIVPEGRWYILPWAALRGRVGLKIPSANAAKGGEFRKYAEAWGWLLGGRRRRLRGGISASGVFTRRAAPRRGSLSVLEVAPQYSQVHGPARQVDSPGRGARERRWPGLVRSS